MKTSDFPSALLFNEIHCEVTEQVPVQYHSFKMVDIDVDKLQRLLIYLWLVALHTMICGVWQVNDILFDIVHSKMWMPNVLIYHSLLEKLAVEKLQKWIVMSVFISFSLWRSDTIWRQRSGSTLAQVIACCLTAPSHYLKQCWLIVIELQRNSYYGNFTRDASTINH